MFFRAYFTELPLSFFLCTGFRGSYTGREHRLQKEQAHKRQMAIIKEDQYKQKAKPKAKTRPQAKLTEAERQVGSWQDVLGRNRGVEEGGIYLSTRRVNVFYTDPCSSRCYCSFGPSLV